MRALVYRESGPGGSDIFAGVAQADGYGLQVKTPADRGGMLELLSGYVEDGVARPPSLLDAQANTPGAEGWIEWALGALSNSAGWATEVDPATTIDALYEREKAG